MIVGGRGNGVGGKPDDAVADEDEVVSDQARRFVNGDARLRRHPQAEALLLTGEELLLEGGDVYGGRPDEDASGLGAAGGAVELDGLDSGERIDQRPLLSPVEQTANAEAVGAVLQVGPQAPGRGGDVPQADRTLVVDDGAGLLVRRGH